MDPATGPRRSSDGQVTGTPRLPARTVWKSRWTAYLLGALMFISTSGVILIVHNQYVQAGRATEQAKLSAVADQLAARVSRELARSFEVLGFVAAFAGEEDMIAVERELSRAHRLLRHTIALNLIDRTRVIRAVTPLEGNRPALGRTVGQSAMVVAVLDDAERSGLPRATSVVPLFQGGQGFVTYFPIQRQGVFDGFVNGVFSVPPLLADVLSGAVDAGVSITVTEDDLTLARLGEAQGPTIESTRAIPVLNRTWTLTLRTSPARESADRPVTAIMLGGVASALIGAVLLVVALRQRAVVVLRAEAQRLAERRLSTVMDNAYEAILSVDGARRIIALNGAAERLTGRRRAELLGQPVQSLSADLDHALLQGDPGSAGDWRPIAINDRAGKPVSALASMATVSEGENTSTTAIIRDLTEIERANAELAALVAEADRQRARAESTRDELQASQQALVASEKLAAVGRLTAGIAHDLNNLLTVVTLNLELLDGSLPPEPDALSSIVSAVDQCKQLVGQLLTFARQQALTPRPTDLDRLVRSSVELLRRAVGDQITIEIESRPASATCLVDPTFLQAALLNLVVNSRDAMPSGGMIAVATADRTLPNTRTGATGPIPPGRYASLTVTDHGVGIEPSSIGRIFDPFFTTKPAGSGTGLGLSMVFGFVTQSRGHILVQSEPGAGTRIELLFPHAAITEGASRSIPASTSRAGKRLRVLVVDDREDVADVMSKACRHLDLDVTTTTDYETAARLLDGDVDLLLSDVRLGPGPTGFDLARRALRRDHPPQVLLVSGYTEDPCPADLAERGVRLVFKPLSMQSLRDAIDALAPLGLSTAG